MAIIPCLRDVVDNYTFSKFMAKVELTPECWNWTGYRTYKWTKEGKVEKYGLFSYKGKLKMAHRLSFIWWIGPIPYGKILDHVVCNNMGCVNPFHLEIVTQYENVVERGTGITAENSWKVRCPEGRIYDKINSQGKRCCSICMYNNTVRSRVKRGIYPQSKLRDLRSH